MSACQNFCFINIYSPELAWGVSLLVTTFALLVFSIWETKTKLKSTEPLFVKLTYILIISSTFIYLVIILASEIIFYVHKSACCAQRSLAIFRAFLYCIQSFILEITVLLVPAHWFMNNLDYFRSPEETKKQRNQKQKQSIKGLIIFSERSLKVLIFYVGLIVTLEILALLVYSFSSQIQNCTIFIAQVFICWKVEGLILVLVLVLGVKSLQTIQNLVKTTQYKRMRNNYFKLIGCITLRIVIEGSYLPIINLNNTGISIIYSYINSILAVYLPILLILMMYRLQREAQTQNSDTSSQKSSRASPHNNPNIMVLDIDTGIDEKRATLTFVN